MMIDRYVQNSDHTYDTYDCSHKQIDTVRESDRPLIVCAACKRCWIPTVADTPSKKHCDAYIQDFTAPQCLRFFLLVQRMPAIDGMLCHAVGVRPKLFATYEGSRVRVVMASRIGDVGITRRLDAEDGYEKRVMIEDLTGFGETA